MEIREMHDGQAGFPEGLKAVYQPPKRLYFRGNPDLGPGVAVVGTRKMSDYGRQCVRLLVPELVRLGMTIVSGLALGIDGEAHRTALDAGGRTAAVIGSGLDDDSIYPRAHLELARRIMKEGGCMFSEYPPGTPSLRHHFPERNRIIAGLSLSVLVIEAPRRSGARITARLALEAGRDVWAVPGPITQPNAWAPNELIRNGATPITSPDDLAQALGLKARPEPPPDLAPEERKIIDLLAKEPLSADQLARACGHDARKTAALLTELELRGLIASLGGGRFSLYT